jgi:hypothetical protein
MQLGEYHHSNIVARAEQRAMLLTRFCKQLLHFVGFLESV